MQKQDGQEMSDVKATTAYSTNKLKVFSGNKCRFKLR